MQLKRYEKLGCSAVWSNSKLYSQLLATSSFNNDNQNLFDLELLSIDFGSRSKDLDIVGRAAFNAPFRCLAWGTFGEKDQSLPYGLIFGGMENGAFTLWNPAEMIDIPNPITEEQIEEQRSLLYVDQPEQQSYPILCAEWNNLKNNFLAFGSTNLLLLDVGKDVTSPDILKPSQNNPHEGSSISSVSWNKQVAHILASAGSDGLIALWDIKTNKSIFQFKDSGPSTSYRQVQIAWSKHISTQIAVTLDDDKKNQLQIWDLRNQKGPIVVIDKIHTKGINSIDWSDLEHDLILASSRDRRVVCWNYKQDESPLNTCQFSEDVEKVAWSKSLSSIYSVTTKSGLQIYSMDDKNLMSYVPKWLKVPAISAFNGNESLLIYSQEKPNTVEQYKIKVETKKDIAENIELLSEYFQNNTENLKELEGEEGEFWKLLSTKKSQESDSDIYNFLGFNKDKITSEVEKYTGKKRSNATQNPSKKKSKAPKADYIPVSGEAAASFFGSLGTSVTHKREQSQNQHELQNIKYDTVKLNNNWDIGRERLIKHNMLIGNYDGAIDAALKCGRTAEALIIAYSVDQNTFNNTLKAFFTETTDHFISDILKHIAFKDTEQLVLKYDLNKWKECIAIIYSISTSDKRKKLLKLLGDRICQEQKENADLQEAAIYAYILADEFESIVEDYSLRIQHTSHNLNQRKANSVYYATKLIGIFQALQTDTAQSPAFQKILREAAIVCLEAGKKVLSYNLFTKYLSSTSFRFIDYLINTTEELAQYRNKGVFTVSLPVMTRKQSTQNQGGKSKKSQKKQQAVQEKKPQRPAPKVYSQPMPVVEVSEEETASKSQAQVYMQANRKRNNPPPAPPKKTGPKPVPPVSKNQFEEEEQTRAQIHHQNINMPPKKQNVPPPPKIHHNPPPTQHQHQHTSHPPPPPPPHHHEQESFHEQKKTIPRPPTKKIHQSQEEQNHHQHTTEVKQHVPPPPPQKMHKNPPPKPAVKYSQKEEEEEEINQSYSEQHRNPPPPPPPHKNVPPPQKGIPPPQKQIPISPKNPIGTNKPPSKPINRMPPPRNQPEQDEDDLQDDSGEQEQQQPQTRVPPPPPVKKGPPPVQGKGRVGPPPMPSKPPVKQEATEYEEESKQEGKRVPPPRKIPQPPRR